MRTPLVASAIRAQRQATIAVLEGLEPPAWDVSVDAGRPVRTIVAHLLAVDAALAAGRLGAVTRIPPEPGPLIGVNPVAGARWEAADPVDLVEALTRSGERLARRVRALPSPLGGMPVGGAAGRWSLLGLVAWHVLDEWVRVGDIVPGIRGAGATAPDADGGGETVALVDEPRGAVLADVVLGTLPRRVLPRVPREHGAVRLVVELVAPVTGDDDVGLSVGPRRTWGIDFPRRQYGPRVTTTPDAVVHVTAPALVLVAAGRVAWRTLAPSALRNDGDVDLAADVLDAIAPVSAEQPG